MRNAKNKQMELRILFAMELFAKLSPAQQQTIIDRIIFLLSGAQSNPAPQVSTIQKG